MGTTRTRLFKGFVRRVLTRQSTVYRGHVGCWVRDERGRRDHCVREASEEVDEVGQAAAPDTPAWGSKDGDPERVLKVRAMPAQWRVNHAQSRDDWGIRECLRTICRQDAWGIRDG